MKTEVLVPISRKKRCKQATDVFFGNIENYIENNIFQMVFNYLLQIPLRPKS